MTPGGFVYFIKPVGLEGPIKIGTAIDPSRRLSQLNTISPIRLEVVLAVPGGSYVEHSLHAHFAEVRSHGEWFSPSSPLLTFIEALRTGANVAALISLAPRKTTFAAFIDTIGVGPLAKALDTNDNHVRTMKARDSVPPEYWPQLIELAPAHDIPKLDWQTLSQLRKDRFRSAPEAPETPAEPQALAS